MEDTTYTQWGGLIETMYSQFSEEELIASGNRRIVTLRKKLKKLEKTESLEETYYVFSQLGLTNKIRRYLASPLLDQIFECCVRHDDSTYFIQRNKFKKSFEFFSKKYDETLFKIYFNDYLQYLEENLQQKKFSEKELKFLMFKIFTRRDSTDFYEINLLVLNGAPTHFSPSSFQARVIAMNMYKNNSYKNLRLLLENCGVTIETSKIYEYLYGLGKFKFVKRIKEDFAKYYKKKALGEEKVDSPLLKPYGFIPMNSALLSPKEKDPYCNGDSSGCCATKKELDDELNEMQEARWRYFHGDEYVSRVILRNNAENIEEIIEEYNE